MRSDGMKKILILSNSMDGFYRFRNELIIKLLKEDYSVFLSAPIDAREDYYRQLGVIVTQTKISRRSINPFKDLKLFLFYIRLINKYKPDHVLTYTIKPNVYGGLAARLAKIPYIANITGLGTAIENKGIIQNIAIKLYKIGLKKASMIFFQNQENLNFMISKGVRGHSYQLLPGSGVNINYFDYSEYPSQDRLHFLFIGRVMKSKGIDYFLESAKYVNEKYPNTVFHVIGDLEEDYKEKISEYVSKSYIKYHGKTDDIRDFLKMSHAIIHPSFHEGMSNVLLESASSGRPVIASNIAGCKETFEENKTGLSFIVKNQELLNTAIEKFIKLPHEHKKKMGIAGRDKMVKEFSRENIVNKYIEAINKIKEDKK